MALVGMAALLAALPSWSLPLEIYAPNSKLATGKWRKVCVRTTGMQFISNAQLKSLGFSDPSKVNVYGYGGQMQAEPLEKTIYVDDLPQQPVVRVSGGLVFYGVNTGKWAANAGDYVPFVHINSPYAADSYYFLSDIEMPEKEMNVLRYDTVRGGTRQDYFMEHAFHEKELAAPHDMGTWMFGEDFMTEKSQDFVIKLPGLVADRARSGIKYGFGVKSQGTKGEGGVMPNCVVRISTNGVELPFDGNKNSGDLIETVTNTDEGFIRATHSSKIFPNPADETTVNITLEPQGAVQFARLDYIMISYPRKLVLDEGGVLQFSGYRTVFDTVTYVMEGCSDKTQIWDVTDPARPELVKFNLEGTQASFTPMRSLYRDYIAFEPERVTLAPAPAGNVANQDLHSRAVPDMVIITPPEFRSQAERLADFHRRTDDMDVLVVEPQALYNEFSSGSPDLMAYRKALKMWYDRGLSGGTQSKLGYCLLFGRSYFDMREITPGAKNRGYPFLLMYQNPDPSIRPTETSNNSHTSQYSSDDFIVSLDDNTRSFVFDKGLPYAQVAVGRMPVKSVKEAEEMVDKIINYVENPQRGIASNQVLLIADDGDQGNHLKQAELMYKRMREDPSGAGFQYEKLYMDAYKADPTPQGFQHAAARERNLTLLDQGVAYWLYTGHGNQRELTHEAFFTYQDATGLKNKFIPFMYTATCDYAPVDRETISAGELIWGNPAAGAICMLTTTRGVWISSNKYMNEELAKQLMMRDDKGRPLPIGHIVRRAKNNVSGFESVNNSSISKRETQVYRFILLGDPAVRLPLPEYRVKVDMFGDQAVDSTDFQAPTLEGNSRVTISGSITDLKGKPAAGFSGELNIVLFDSERMVRAETSTADEIQFYNAYTNILFRSVVKVEKGKWSTELLIPSEIQNNYNKALINFYAVTPGGRWANGKFDDFYIYGLSEGGADREGPEITGFTLNTPGFRSGDVVGMQAVAYATMTDRSGINISTQGIGHQISLSLDGKTHFTDVANYYTPVVNDICSGQIVYPLNDLDPGDHTLTLTVWDNANNSSTAELQFRVTADPRPQIYDVRTDANPASSSVTFTVMHDRMLEDSECEISVYDLTGRRLWSSRMAGNDDMTAGTSVKWNLADGSGQRVPRGIYLYRAVITGSNGVSVSKTKKLAVTAQ